MAVFPLSDYVDFELAGYTPPTADDVSFEVNTAVLHSTTDAGSGVDVSNISIPGGLTYGSPGSNNFSLVNFQPPASGAANFNIERAALAISTDQGSGLDASIREKPRYVPPSAHNVDFALARYWAWTSDNVLFELGCIDKTSTDSGGAFEQLAGRDVALLDQANGQGASTFVLWNPMPFRGDQGQGDDTSFLRSLFAPIETGFAQDVLLILISTIPGRDSGYGSKEHAIIPSATRTTADSGVGSGSVTGYIKDYFETSSSDSGGGTGASALQAQAAAKDRGLAQEVPPAIETLLQALQEGVGKDRKLHVFVVRLGEPWGMVKVTGLGKIQE